jgi:dephospho-CoA kinase
LLRVGLTGGIASGKSAVGEMFVSLGAHLIQADKIAHQLMEPGEVAYGEIVKHFGPGILNVDGSINRRQLAEEAFGSRADGKPGPSRIQELNQLLHPAVIQRQDEWMAEVASGDPQAMAVVEAALILEAGAATHFDRLVVVTCRPEQRVERWARRTGVDLENARLEVTRRMAAQWPDEEKIKQANYVIDNSGSLEDTRRQAGEVFAAMKSAVTSSSTQK